MKLTLLAAIALVLLASPPVAAQQSRDERDLIQLVKEIQAATTRQDHSALERALAADFLNVHSTGQLKSKAEWLADVRAGTTKFTNEEPEDFRVRVYGDTAVVHYRIRGRGQVLGKPQSGQFRVSRVFVRRDGRWQCVAAHWTNVAEAPR